MSGMGGTKGIDLGGATGQARNAGRQPVLLIRLLLALADVAVLAAVFHLLRTPDLAAPIVLYTFGAHGQVTASQAAGLDWFLVPALALVLLSLVTGQYGRRRPFWDEMRLFLKSCLIVAGVDIVVLVISQVQGSLLMMVTVWVAVGILVPVGRLLAKRILLTTRLWQVPTVIIGTGENAYEALMTFRQEPLLGLDVVAFIHVGGDRADTTCAAVRDSGVALQVIDADALPRALPHPRRPHVVVALDYPAEDGLLDVVDALLAEGYTVDVAPPLRGLPLIGMETSHVFGREAIILHTRNALSRPAKRMLKRLFDVMVSLLVITLGAPLFLVLAWLIRRESDGPAFFLQERVGLDGRSFQCIKFRSMRIDAEEVLQRWKEEEPALWDGYVKGNFKLRDDPRVTRVGKFLRKSSLDELPQVFNVLRGEMSIVGPRPLLRREIGDYGRPYRHYRRVRPGITGLWQISGRSHTTFLQRAYYDDWYIKNWSLWYDIVIVMKTFVTVLRRSGAY